MTLQPSSRRTLRLLLYEWQRGTLELEEFFDRIEELWEGVTPTTPPDTGTTSIAPSP